MFSLVFMNSCERCVSAIKCTSKSAALFSRLSLSAA